MINWLQIMVRSLLDPLKRRYIRRFRSYDALALCRRLAEIGLSKGDTLMVHSSWLPFNGFTEKPARFCAALREAVGEEGLVVMPSLTYHNMTSAEFLATGKPMNVRRSPSAMGLLTEVFRRGKGVVRSLSPTHPLLAWGKDADQFIAGHKDTDRPFGSESPFARLLERNALILCVDAGFSSITFTHFVEDQLARTLDVPLYEPSPIDGTVIDAAGAEHIVPTRVLSAAANKLRREQRLIAHLSQAGSLQEGRIGNTRLTWIRALDHMRGAEKLATSGLHFFDPAKPMAPIIN